MKLQTDLCGEATTSGARTLVRFTDRMTNDRFCCANLWRSRTPKRGEAGAPALVLTLIELLVVIALIAILAQRLKWLWPKRCGILEWGKSAVNSRDREDLRRLQESIPIP